MDQVVRVIYSLKILYTGQTRSFHPPPADWWSPWIGRGLSRLYGSNQPQPLSLGSLDPHVSHDSWGSKWALAAVLHWPSMITLKSFFFWHGGQGRVSKPIHWRINPWVCYPQHSHTLFSSELPPAYVWNSSEFCLKLFYQSVRIWIIWSSQNSTCLDLRVHLVPLFFSRQDGLYGDYSKP